MDKKTALVIGSEGQDGTLLCQLLTQKGYKVWGLGSKKKHLVDPYRKFIRFDLAQANFNRLITFFETYKPNEVYYVAAFHQSSQEKKADFSLEFINKSIHVNQLAFARTLEIAKQFSPSSKFFYTSSSLIFEGCSDTVQNEATVPKPKSIYAITKLAAMHVADFYRKEYKMFISIGIMYNHESILRNENFLSKKIVNAVKEIKSKTKRVIKIGNLSAITDWGYAPDYVNAMWHIMQQDKADTYIISSGKGHTVLNWFEVLGFYLKFDLNKHIKEDKKLIIRKKSTLIGDNKKLLSIGWRPKTSFENMIVKMYENKI